MVHSSMTVLTPQSRLESRRAKVADAARLLFLRHGFHGTGIAQIAEASGIKVQQIYRDFANKEAIVAHLAADDIGLLFAQVSEVTNRVGGSGGSAELRAWLRQFLATVSAKEPPTLFVEIVAEASRNDRIATILRDLDQSASTALAAAFTAFARPGTDPAHLANVADLFLVFISGLVNRSVSYPDMDMSPIEEIMCDTIVAQIPTA